MDVALVSWPAIDAIARRNASPLVGSAACPASPMFHTAKFNWRRPCTRMLNRRLSLHVLSLRRFCGTAWGRRHWSP